MLYIAFLRGMNVPGRSVKMEHLRELFTELGFTNVRTYIQSGNVFFETPAAGREALTRKVFRHLHDSLGYEVAVCLRTVPELEKIRALDPFQGVPITASTRHCVVFTTEPIADLQLPLSSPKKDMVIVRTTKLEAFVIWHLVNGKAPAAKAFQEKALGRDATTRYYHTFVKILDAAKAE